MELRIREVDKGDGGLTGTHASEAKGPFSRREEGWELGEKGKGKEKEKEKESHLGKYGARNFTHGQRGYLGRWSLQVKVLCVRILLR